MLTITENQRIFVACCAFDFRMGIDGFAAVCRKYFLQDPLQGQCFLFRNKRHTAIKILLYDGRGFWLCHKRLSKGRFAYWPTAPTASVIIDTALLNRLLSQ